MKYHFIYGLLGSGSALAYLLILMFVYARKTKIPSSKTTIYKALMILILIETLIQISACFSISLFGWSPIGHYLWRLYILCFVTSILLISLYVSMLIKNSTETNLFKIIKSSKKTIVASIVLCIAFVVFMVMPLNNPIFIPIEGTPYVYSMPIKGIMCGSCLIALILHLITVFKYFKKVNVRKKIILIITIPFIIVNIPMQLCDSLFVKMSIIPFFYTLYTYIIYSIVENPEIAILEETKKIEAELGDKEKPKSDFLAELNDDIKLPSNRLLELCNELKLMQTYDEKVVKEKLNSINNTGTSILEMIDNILDVSQIKTATSALQERKYDTKDLIKNVMDYSKEKIGSKKIKLVMRISPALSSKLYGDYTKLYQSLTNIVSKAAETTEVGKIIITVTSSKSNNIELVTFKITDTGSGMTDTEKAGIFTSEKESNYGIKISKEYVETMKGKLWFETKEEAGTTFFVQVPQRITDATPIGSLEDINAVAKVDTANIDYSKYRILIVDDNVLNIKLTTRILSEYNFNIESVTSGNEAVYKVKAGEKYDAIFLDIMMPEMDGVETLHVLEQLEAAKETTIIALTANSISGMKELYLSEGFDEYLAKPIKKKNLEQIISKYFNK